MARTPKTAPITAGQDLRERQALAARGARGGKRPDPVSVAGEAVKVLAQQSRVDTGERRPGPTSATETGIGKQVAPRFTFPQPAEPASAPPPLAPGTYRIDQLHLGQCRFACTPHGAASHRFCGARTEIGPANRWGSWCAEHLPLVTCMPGRTPGGASKADLIAKDEGVVA